MNLEPHDKHKKLSRFMCQELLYEFVTGRLDTEKQKSVDTFLSNDRDTQRELEQLKRGLRYTAQAGRAQISPKLREALLKFEPQWKKNLSAWTLWSSQRGWKILPYVFVTLALVLGLAVTKPWRPSSHHEIVLVEQLKAEPDIVSPPADVLVEHPSIKPMVEVSAPAPTPALVPATSIPATDTSGVVSPVVQKEDEEDKTQTAGAITRGDLEATDFAGAWPAIREKIEALGGKAAGNVELGWMRKKDESYFHFSLPESNRKELELFLKTFGPVRFSTERHPRVMPEGQIRIILTVKDGNSHDGREEAETP